MPKAGDNDLPLVDSLRTAKRYYVRVRVVYTSSRKLVVIVPERADTGRQKSFEEKAVEGDSSGLTLARKVENGRQNAIAHAYW